jgi:hypothetical protein
VLPGATLYQKLSASEYPIFDMVGTAGLGSMQPLAISQHHQKQCPQWGNGMRRINSDQTCRFKLATMRSHNAGFQKTVAMTVIWKQSFQRERR